MRATTLFWTLPGAVHRLDLLEDGRFAICRDEKTLAIKSGFPEALSEFNSHTGGAPVCAGGHVSEFTL